MGELANYSIETDQLIWLAFKDGKSIRVPVASLPNYLSPRDLQKVRRAMNLRQDFLRHNMPKTLVAVLAFGLLALMVAGGQAIARLEHGGSVAPHLPNTQIVRSAPPASNELSPAPSPDSNTAASLARRPTATPKAKPALAARVVTSHPAALPTPGIEVVKIPDENVAELPIATPAPSPTPIPTPVPTPVPTPPAGQVLGDSTSPDAEPKPSPGP